MRESGCGAVRSGAPSGGGGGVLGGFTLSAAAPAGVGGRASRRCAGGRPDALAISDYRAWRKPAEGTRASKAAMRLIALVWIGRLCDVLHLVRVVAA